MSEKESWIKEKKSEAFTGFVWIYCHTNHSFIPDEGHPFLHSVHTFWDLSEVILADSLLGHAEGAVGTARHAQVSTTALTNMTEKIFIFNSWIVRRNSSKKKNPGCGLLTERPTLEMGWTAVSSKFCI